MSHTAFSDRATDDPADPPAAAPATRSDAIPGRRALLSRDDQVVVAAALLVALAGGWLYAGGLRGGLVEIDAAPPLPVAFEVDLNEAAWPELALLPGVGETMARRIVHSRETEGPFVRRADLRRVHGVGPTLLARMKPYLRPLAADETVAAR